MAAVLVIGGASGLGGEIAKAFLQQGDAVLLMDEVAPDGCLVDFAALDLASPDVGERIVQAVCARLGGLDVLVIAASAMESAPIHAWTAAMWDRACAINLRLPFLAVQGALPLLQASRNASVTIVSSTATLRGQPYTHAYQATKAGIAGLVRSLAAELGPDRIRVNAVLGGWLDTPLTRAYWETIPDAPSARAGVDGRIPLRRHGSAAEAAALVRFLASDAASYMTGAMLPVDGGDTAV
ncbi:short-chain dehydrogenase/reductase SDR [Novosphingobium sp. Rr 2-17]|uniref:SDR family NAD(P)-dependent oxidoreductase n=1 Tax=Novosphingobium sp. Rr 2-17 TaxID=555793 RepID=UPI000269A54F|nr:SDR family oxidoreductase [Novosphingobium sp. Rr 2-17]EIZ77877.1 short-chain dehydrogenase/reductase SDR [Novosphingobium sp. Rr 2-17]